MTKLLSRLIAAIFAILLPLTASADEQIDIKAGVAFDMGFGVSALINDQFNVMLGNDGMAADYQLKKGAFNADLPFTWYVAGGGYRKWGESFGARLPLGLNLNFENNLKNWNAYTQIAPDIEVNDDDDNEVKFSAQFAIGLRYTF